MEKIFYEIIRSDYNPSLMGCIGTLGEKKNEENVAFYPVKENYPYRVCLQKEWVKKISLQLC